MNVPELIAHRGYTLRYPENTLVSVRKALEAGADYVEIDVQLSSDRVPYLFHDRLLDRVCGVEGALHERTSAEIAALRASEPWRFGERFAAEPVASLADFAALIATSRDARAFVEVKRSAIERFGAPVVLERVLRAIAPIEARCTLISFDVSILQEARRTSAVALGPVLTTWERHASEEVASLLPEVVFCDHDKLPAEGSLRQPHGKLAVYEVADPPRALELAARGVELVESFAIAEMLRALGKPSSGAAGPDGA